MRLAGPGVESSQGIAPEMGGVPLAAYEELAAVNAEYPLGVDAVFLSAAGELMALPRSTRIRVLGD